MGERVFRNPFRKAYAWHFPCCNVNGKTEKAAAAGEAG
jgi:hypothetical protein